jgi:hypothetical protein
MTKHWKAAVLVMCLLATGLVFGTVPDPSGVIRGCYDKKTGQLRVIDSANAACTSKETDLAWSQVGPPGATGDQGDPGAQGPTGSTGATGPQGAAAGGARVITINGSANGTGALDACPADYHMASMWEIREPSALRYEPTGYLFPNIDHGDGPPGGVVAWVRTGTGRNANGGFTNPPNCRMWTSVATGDFGALASLTALWNPEPSGLGIPATYSVPAAVWVIKEEACDQPHPVWCVKD